MSKTTLLAALGIVVLVIICGAYFFLHKSDTNSLTTSQKEQSEKMAKQPKSLTDFLSMTGSQKCTFSDTSSGSSGTLYVADGKLSGAFQSALGGKQTVAHMVNDGSYFYIWTEDTNQGYKIADQTITEMSKNAANGQSQSSTPIDFNQKADYACDSWRTDSSVFDIPKTISFKDYTATMQQMMKDTTISPTSSPNTNSSTGTNRSACSACDQLSGSAQAQCRTALKCE